MDTNSATLHGVAAAVSGARHLRAGRNGQDSAAVWSEAGVGAAVVCDGCSSGASSEVGARLGAQLVIGALAARLRADTDGVRDAAWWQSMRDEVGGALLATASALPGDLADVVHEHFLFTIVAAVVVGDQAIVWAIGDGAYAIDGVTRELGPFANNQPPYLGYDLLGTPSVATFDVAPFSHDVLVATDGVAEIGLDLLAGVDAFVRHPDALRRKLFTLARGAEQIDWAARRVVRTPAPLQDDGAVALLVRGAA